MTAEDLKRKLLPKLDRVFCQDLLIELQQDCSSWVSENLTRSPNPNQLVYVYLLIELLQNIQSWMESLEPIAPALHDEIEAKIAPSLKAAVTSLDSNNPDDMANAFSALIIALAEA